jgi:hypothetical protein
MTSLYQGDFACSAREFAHVYAAGRRSGNSQHQVWGQIGQAESLLRLGQMDEAVGLLDAALDTLAESPDRAEELRAWGLLAAARWRQGEPGLAQSAADSAARLIASLRSPTAHYLLEGYAGVAEVYLALWEASSQQSPAESRKLARQALQACAGLRKFARVFPIGRPRARLLQGRAEWLAGRSSRAMKAWRASLAEAAGLGMRYEEALAREEIGRYSAR